MQRLLTGTVSARSHTRFNGATYDRRRRASRLTTAQIAEACDVPADVAESWETQGEPAIGPLHALADLFGCEVGDLLDAGRNTVHGRRHFAALRRNANLSRKAVDRITKQPPGSCARFEAGSEQMPVTVAMVLAGHLGLCLSAFITPAVIS